MGEPIKPRVTPPNPIREPAPPSQPQVPGQGFATCTSDDAAMLRVPNRNPDDPAYKKRGVRLLKDWFPSSPIPSAGNQVVAYVYGSCAFTDMAQALATAYAPEHRIYILGWSTDKGTQLKPGSGNTLEDFLRNTRAQVRGMFYDGLFTITPLIKRSADGVENKWINDTINLLPNGASVIDGKHPPLGIHHQKLLVVQGRFGIVAFIGGMDFDSKRINVNPQKGEP